MRRFSEFHMLFVKLQEEFPGVIVPPCPEKNQLGGFRKSSAFIEQRRQALEVFINKVCGHRLLKHSELLQQFLEADETSWHVKMQELKSGPEQGSLLGKMSQLASDIVHSTKNLTKGQSDDQGEDAEYLQVCKHILRSMIMPESTRACALMARPCVRQRCLYAQCVLGLLTNNQPMDSGFHV